MKKFYRRSISGLLALLICFTTILSSGVTAFAASSSGETAKSYSVAFPRDGDANLDTSGTWGHDELHYMNGWTSGEKTWMTTLHTIGDFNGPACYCIEPGVPRLLERTYAHYGEDYWKDYPSECNSTIDADTIKTLLGRIMQYGYQGNLSLGWRSQNDADADKLALMMATQVLVAALIWLFTLVRLVCTVSPSVNLVFSGLSRGISSFVTGNTRSSPCGREITRISSSSFTASTFALR